MKRPFGLMASLAVLTVTLLTGCSSTPTTHYAWNDYPEIQRDRLEQKINDEAYLERLLGAVEEAQSRGVKVAPGIYADIGTFYARANQFSQAQKYYELEAQTWPESAPLMHALIDSFNRLQKQRSVR